MIPIAVAVPEVGTSDAYELPYRIIKMAIEEPIHGKNDVPNYLQFGSIPGWRYKAYFVNTGVSPAQAVANLQETYDTYHIRHLIGPYTNAEAPYVAGWASATMPNSPVVVFNADTDVLSNKTIFPNIFRVCFTNYMYNVGLTNALATRQWKSIVGACMLVGRAHIITGSAAGQGRCAAQRVVLRAHWAARHPDPCRCATVAVTCSRPTHHRSTFPRRRSRPAWRRKCWR